MDQSLLVFVTVAEKQSFTRAADALHMTQPAVSQYIQTLEKNLGVKLLDRNNKYVQLNKLAKSFFITPMKSLGCTRRCRRCWTIR